MFRRLRMRLRDSLYDLKYRHQRAKRGYSDSDWFGMDSWFLEIIPKMLREFPHGISYPGREPWETPEKWYAELEYIARGFEELRRLREEPWDVSAEVYEELKRDTFEHFIAVFDDLWD